MQLLKSLSLKVTLALQLTYNPQAYHKDHENCARTNGHKPEERDQRVRKAVHLYVSFCTTTYVLSTNLVLKLILFKAPIDLELASVNSLLCNSITRQIRYSRKNMGKLSGTSIETIFSGITRGRVALVVHLNLCVCV